MPIEDNKKIKFVNKKHAQCFEEEFRCEAVSFCPNGKICEEMEQRNVTALQEGVKRLRCFDCTQQFKDKKEIFRNCNGHPKCEDCFREELDFEWAEEFTDTIIREVRDMFNGSYNKWHKDFFENNEECAGEHEYYDPMYFPKDQLTEVDGKKYCEICMEERRGFGLDD